MISEFRRISPLTLAFAAFAFANSLAIGQTKEAVLPVSMEPNHHVRFDNGTVRVYDVQVPKGKWTQFHEHTEDNFFVFINPATLAYEFKDGRHVTRHVKPGEVGFASTATGAYTHRVTAEGDLPFHAVDIEILHNMQFGSDAAAPKRLEPFFKIVLENSRGRAYDIRLKPGESTALFRRTANTGIVAVTGGRVSETADGKMRRLWDAEPGDFRWSEVSEKLTIQNNSVMDEEFVEIELL